MADWSDIEVEIVVNDYFDMLKKELAGKPYNKSEHGRRIQTLINRSHKSIEFKHQNISAVLVKFGTPFINGYKPAWNYQRLLEGIVGAHLKQNPSLEMTFEAFAKQKAETPLLDIDFGKWKVPPPTIKHLLKEHMSEYLPVKKNFLEMEQRNASVGHSGEELVFEYEKWRLNMAGKEKLAESVEWVSKELGDGLGYDILSKNLNGKDMFIEVKTTKLGKETPIFFSKRENDFSENNQDKFHLYRVFDLNSQVKMFQRNGRFQDFCMVEAVGFKGMF